MNAFENYVPDDKERASLKFKPFSQAPGQESKKAFLSPALQRNSSAVDAFAACICEHQSLKVIARFLGIKIVQEITVTPESAPHFGIRGPRGTSPLIKITEPWQFAIYSIGDQQDIEISLIAWPHSDPSRALKLDLGFSPLERVDIFEGHLLLFTSLTICMLFIADDETLGWKNIKRQCGFVDTTASPPSIIAVYQRGYECAVSRYDNIHFTLGNAQVKFKTLFREWMAGKLDLYDRNDVPFRLIDSRGRLWLKYGTHDWNVIVLSPAFEVIYSFSCGEDVMFLGCREEGLILCNADGERVVVSLAGDDLPEERETAIFGSSPR